MVLEQLLGLPSIMLIAGKSPIATFTAGALIAAHVGLISVLVFTPSYTKMTPKSRVQTMICEYTLFQLEHFQPNEYVQSRLQAGNLKLHAWVVDDSTARVYAFDPKSHSFRSDWS